jgi:release factor glutamine methyltransferase
LEIRANKTFNSNTFILVYFTTDINEFACKATIQTGIKNQVNTIEAIRTSLIDGILPRLKNKVDVLCFNPPYVVTTHEEVGSHGIEAAWAGGIDGREVIDELLPKIKVGVPAYYIRVEVVIIGSDFK